MHKTNWTHAPDTLTLDSHHVDIWRLNLNHLPDSVKSIESTLSADEKERAARFRFEVDKNRFIVAHGVLRKVLSLYLHRDPAELEFSLNEYGKPALVNSNLEFNLSHSGDFVLIAITQGRKVGVDVERIRQGISSHVIARQYFSKAEIDELQSLPIEQRVAAFFICWTRKEAYIKAHGLGLSLPLESFDVSLTPGQPAIVRATRPEPEEAARWRLLSMDVDPEYAGALAVEGSEFDIRYFSFQ